MPILQEDDSKIERVILPSTKDLPAADQAWVDIKTGRILGGDMAAVEALSDSEGVSISVAMVANRIREWNYTEKDGTPVPITVKSVARLNFGDLGFLAAKLNPTGEADPIEADPKKNELS